MGDLRRPGPGFRDRLRLPLLVCLALGVAVGWTFWGRGGGWVLAASVGAVPLAALPQIFRGEILWRPYLSVIRGAFRVFYAAPGFHDLQIVEESVSTATVATLFAWSAGLGLGGLAHVFWPTLPWCAG